MTTWEDVAKKVEQKLKSALSYAKITTIRSVEDYLSDNAAQAVIDSKGYLVLISPPESGAESVVPRLTYRHEKLYNFSIAIVSRISPSDTQRMYGAGIKKGIFEVQADVFAALEHNTLDGLVDPKPGTNFEDSWSVVPQEDRGISVYVTTYTARKIE